MAARLKVFVTSDGFTDYVVAVSSRAKALAAWNVRQDVFKEGLAHETDDADLVRAALAQPGEVLRRPARTRGQLARLKAPARPKPTGPSKAALKKIADLERRIAAVGLAHAKALSGVDVQIDDLRRRRAALSAAQDKELADLTAQLRTARAAPG
jgi:hypothetical protein